MYRLLEGIAYATLIFMSNNNNNNNKYTLPDTHADACGQLSQTGRRCSHSRSKQQDDQVQPASKDTDIVPGGHRNSGHMAWSGGGTDTVNGKVNNDHHWRRQRDHLPSCLWHSKWETRSPLKACSLPASTLQIRKKNKIIIILTSLLKVICEAGRVAAKVDMYAVKSPLVTMARPKFAPKTTFP